MGLGGRIPQSHLIMFDTFFLAVLLDLILYVLTVEGIFPHYTKPLGNANKTPTMDTSTQEVQWQTAFWPLVSLAVLTMSQPCGKVCNLPSRYRTYLRSSP